MPELKRFIGCSICFAATITAGVVALDRYGLDILPDISQLSFIKEVLWTFGLVMAIVVTSLLIFFIWWLIWRVGKGD